MRGLPREFDGGDGAPRGDGDLEAVLFGEALDSDVGEAVLNAEH